ncbi:hypothetical protein BTJ49_09550 [Oleiagrimonas sp. MCCC 1A03011]|nr:hypothetical protein BTJ49_09550 [Oleiagrimonas sp. MCCC 1A03011]
MVIGGESSWPRRTQTRRRTLMVEHENDRLEQHIRIDHVVVCEADHRTVGRNIAHAVHAPV